MKSKDFFKFFTIVLPLMASLMCLAVLTGCDDDADPEEVIVEVHDTLYVEVNVVPIDVDQIVTNPDSIAVGGTLMLTADASANIDEVDANDLTYYWFATGGEFESDEGDTVTWKAPDSEGVVQISVHASDGDYVGVGSMDVGVGMYVPTVTPYFMGDATCGQCHSGTHSDWEETGHADAWATLMDSDHPASYCFRCHSVGYEGDTGNSGYDEAPIALFENVQCENCHGPGSAHAANPMGNDMRVSYEADNCGTCHDGTHHPFVTEWETSPHNFNPYVASHGAGTRGSCSGCHEGVAAAFRLSGSLNEFYGSGSVADRPDTTEVSPTGITCQTCHDSHSNDNPGQVRTVADVHLVTSNGESPIISIGGVGKLCMQCHHARRGPDAQVVEGYGHFGPHANPQADMMAGKSAYHGVADGDFPWAGPSHLNVLNSCKTCHQSTSEFVSNDEPAVVGHSFLPTVDACTDCHGAISSFDDIRALEDFDGDGTVEGVQSEVNGLMDVLASAIIQSLNDNGYSATTVDEMVDAISSVETSDMIHREAGYNYVYIMDDKSHGIHNPDYAIQLLQQSYHHLTGMDVPNALIVRTDNAVADVAR